LPGGGLPGAFAADRSRQLLCFLDRNRLRNDSRVTVSTTAAASAMSPASCAVSPGLPSAIAEELATGSAAGLVPPSDWIPGEVLGVAEGTIAGNRPDALPAPTSELEMIELETPLRFGMGPGGSAVSGGTPADDPAGVVDAEVPGDAEVAAVAAVAAVTATLAAAEGGVHFAGVVTLAVAVSFTEVTEVAPEATGICALRTAGCLSDTEVIAHAAVPSPLAQPLVNAGFWLDGCEVRATDTSATELFWAETCTT
jgi:hypothetical protein